MWKKIFISSHQNIQNITYNATKTQLKNLTIELNALGTKELTSTEYMRYRARYNRIVASATKTNFGRSNLQKFRKRIRDFLNRFQNYGFEEEMEEAMEVDPQTEDPIPKKGSSPKSDTEQSSKERQRRIPDVTHSTNENVFDAPKHGYNLRSRSKSGTTQENYPGNQEPVKDGTTFAKYAQWNPPTESTSMSASSKETSNSAVNESYHISMKTSNQSTTYNSKEKPDSQNIPKIHSTSGNFDVKEYSDRVLKNTVADLRENTLQITEGKCDKNSQASDRSSFENKQQIRTSEKTSSRMTIQGSLTPSTELSGKNRQEQSEEKTSDLHENRKVVIYNQGPTKCMKSEEHKTTTRVSASTRIAQSTERHNRVDDHKKLEHQKTKHPDSVLNMGQRTDQNTTDYFMKKQHNQRFINPSEQESNFRSAHQESESGENRQRRTSNDYEVTVIGSQTVYISRAEQSTNSYKSDEASRMGQPPQQESHKDMSSIHYYGIPFNPTECIATTNGSRNIYKETEDSITQHCANSDHKNKNFQPNQQSYDRPMVESNSTCTDKSGLSTFQETRGLHSSTTKQSFNHDSNRFANNNDDVRSRQDNNASNMSAETCQIHKRGNKSTVARNVVQDFKPKYYQSHYEQMKNQYRKSNEWGNVDQNPVNLHHVNEKRPSRGNKTTTPVGIVDQYRKSNEWENFDQCNQSLGDAHPTYPPKSHQDINSREEIDTQDKHNRYQERREEEDRRHQRKNCEPVPEKPLEILDVHQYFRDDFDINSVDDYPDDMSKISVIESWAQTFDAKVNTFEEDKSSMDYFVLDEKLMRLILKLDRLKCHDDKAATERKVEVIEYIKNLQSILDSRAKDD